jgi:hypothetical protein
VGVGLFWESDRWRWCEFNVLILVQEGRRHDKALSEHEAEIVSSYWLHRKEV